MIYIIFKDRLGNILFQYAAARSLSDRVIICATTEAVYKTATSVKHIFFKESEIIDYIPENIPIFYQNGYLFERIPYKPGEKLIISGYFQSYKYIDINTISNIYNPTESIITSIKKKIPQILSQELTSIHVRRGDYLNMQEKHPFAGLAYYQKAIEYIGKDKLFVVISDDIKWCKRNFKGSNFIFADNTTFIEDLFIQTLCANNIISNSSFSWWGSYLNRNQSKIVIVPSMWFGLVRDVEMSDLIPKDYKIIANQYSVFLYLKLNIKLLWRRIKNYITKNLKY